MSVPRADAWRPAKGPSPWQVSPFIGFVVEGLDRCSARRRLAPRQGPLALAGEPCVCPRSSLLRNGVLVCLGSCAHVGLGCAGCAEAPVRGRLAPCQAALTQACVSTWLMLLVTYSFQHRSMYRSSIQQPHGGYRCRTKEAEPYLAADLQEGGTHRHSSSVCVVLWMPVLRMWPGSAGRLRCGPNDSLGMHEAEDYLRFFGYNTLRPRAVHGCKARARNIPCCAAGSCGWFADGMRYKDKYPAPKLAHALCADGRLQPGAAVCSSMSNALLSWLMLGAQTATIDQEPRCAFQSPLGSKLARAMCADGPL